MQIIEKIAPFYIVFVLIEVMYSSWKGRKVYSFLDSITDIATGSMSRLLDVLVLIIALILY